MDSLEFQCNQNLKPYFLADVIVSPPSRSLLLENDQDNNNNKENYSDYSTYSEPDSFRQSLSGDSFICR